VILGAAIRHLTLEQQQVIVLKFFSGLSTSEIATVLGQSEDAIKAQGASISFP
jgi:DNA-directed RNA polymerase specialized sigma24 family protein